MTGLKISKTLELPIEAATWTFAVLSIKGWGKTYIVADLGEELVAASIPLVVLDGMGIWWGLTVGVDGHHGLEVIVIGGQHQDVPLPLKQIDRIRQNVDEDKLRLLVKAVLDARVSVVLDTAGLSKGIQRRIVATFVSELTRLNANYGTRHVIIEEADLWCPQKGLMGGGDLALSAGAIDDLVRRGGNFNLGCTLITQRSAVLNKDVLTQASCLIVGRILHKIDKDAVKTWVQSMGDPKDPKIIKWYDTLRELKNGEGYVWHPENPVIFRKVMFRKRHTLHATREYFQQIKTTEIKQLDRSEVIESFKKILEPPKAKPESSRPPLSPAPEYRLKRDPPPDKPPHPYQIIAPTGQALPPRTEGKILRVASPELESTNGYVVPDWTLQKLRPEFAVLVDLIGVPPSPIVRVLVVLANADPKSYRDDRWTLKKIKALVRNHGWPEEGVDAAVDQLLRAETLAWRSGYLRFLRERVKVTEEARPVIFKTEAP